MTPPGPLDGRWDERIDGKDAQSGEPLAGTDSARLDEVRALVLEQSGEWVAFGLLIALGEGKIDHWTWDDEAETIGHCYLELLFYKVGKVSDYVGLMKATGAYQALTSADEEEYEALHRGIENTVAKFHDQRADVELVLAEDHARGFLADHAWAQLEPEAFCEAVRQKL